ncbi:hypothetical protein NM688_g48 [Phlebia brevispora]|uniref:Uncharacterized protein n=1 Tax=Phlebia brevispora TaxID=194682 RepID=A0ACC1TFF6_9APHY|nr:hypothetical protein NM688_g48 [Phlebia brevispora]
MVNTRRRVARPPEPPPTLPVSRPGHTGACTQFGQRGGTPPKMAPGIWNSENTRENVHPYIRENLKNAQKVSAGCYSKALFTLPDGGLATWADEIGELNWFDDEIVRSSLAAYCGTISEVERYGPFTRLANRILELARGTLTDVRDTYPVNDFCFAEYDRAVDTIEEHEGLGAVRKPDALGLRKSVAKRIKTKGGKGKKTVHWTDIFLVLEFKCSMDLLEQLNHQRSKRKLGHIDSPTIPAGPSKRPKRNAKKMPATVSRRGRKTKTLPKSNILAPLQDRNEYPSLGANDNPAMVGISLGIQVASYAIELLSCTYGTRAHCLGLSIKDDALCLWYYDASGIVYTEDFLSIIDNFELFAAIIVGLGCCTPEQFGVIPSSVIRPHASYSRKFPPPNLDEGTLTIQNPQFKDVEVTMDQSVFCQYILVGKRTFLYTIETDPPLCKKKLIMKLSYQVTTRKEEYKLVDAAKKVKVRHLPEIHLWADLWKLSDGARDAFLRESGQQAIYEDRVLRAIVYTRYSPIRPLFLDNCLLIPVMVDQMFDCLHDLRYKANILHRDISVNNIMYEKRGDLYQFVLIDFDMAIQLPKDGASGYVATSKHRTGTLPFMAYELIADANEATRNAIGDWAPKRHLLCHDLQSLFWVSIWLMMSLFRHCLEAKKQETALRTLREWETGTLAAISALKYKILHSLENNGIQLPGPTIALERWVWAWWTIFNDVQAAQFKRALHMKTAQADGKEPEPFDEETIGGTFTVEKLKNALTPHMPYKQPEAEITEDDVVDVEPTAAPEPQAEASPETVTQAKPQRKTRKRKRPQDQVIDPENDIRARLRPRRKLA